MNSVLAQAIERSRSHTEIVTVEWDGGDEATLVAELHSLYDGEVDSARENDGTIDVWGYRAEAPEGEMEWRLRVALDRRIPMCRAPQADRRRGESTENMDRRYHGWSEDD